MALKSIEGLPIHDATKDVVITVTATEAKHNGGRLKADDCPIARACKRALGASRVFVHRSRVYIKNGANHYTRYMPSAALRLELIAFDRGARFQGGEFVLRRPRKSEKLGADRLKQRDPKRQTGPKRKRLVPIHVLEGVRESPISD